jgi:hypothetical protein
MDNGQKIPVICLAPSSVAAFQLFNPNDWSGESKAIILSCSTELSVLHFECGNIEKLCINPDQHCLSHFENLKPCCKKPNDILHKTAYYAQIPEIHVFIKAFFASLKGLLDLIVQLLHSEKIVNAKLDGFHRKKGVFGGSVLNALSNNVLSGKEQIAQKIIELIETHKSNWIDGVIHSRDLLVHPMEGIHQLMFEMILESHDDSLIFKRAVPPSVGNQSIDNYARTQVGNIEEFCKSFIARLLDNRAVT